MTILDDLPSTPELRTARADADKSVLCSAIAETHRLGRPARRTRARPGTRSAVTAAVAVVVVALVIVGALALPSPGRSRHAGPRLITGAVPAPKWRLVGDITTSWRTVSPLGFEPTVSLDCPTTSTCYVDYELNAQPDALETYSQIEVTHDGGNTWQRSNLPVTLSDATALACVDADTCATLGIDPSHNAAFLETTDGGETWSLLAGPNQLTSAIGVTVLACTSGESCVAVASDPSAQSGTALAFVTNDKGATWTDSTLPTDFVPRSLKCASAERCVVSGFYQSGDGSLTSPSSTVLYSSDGGASWSVAVVPPDLGPLSSVSCADSADCVASFFGNDGTSSEVLTSADAGASWSEVASSGLPASMVTGLSCPGASDCWASGIARVSGGSDGSGNVVVRLSGHAQGVVASTADFGQSWQGQPLPRGVQIVLDIACPSETSCYAVAFQNSSSEKAGQIQGSFVLLAYGS